MKLKELKPILGKGDVVIWVEGTVQRFWNFGHRDEYVFWKDDSIVLWDIYGEYEINQIYSDDETINIELK